MLNWIVWNWTVFDIETVLTLNRIVINNCLNSLKWKCFWRLNCVVMLNWFVSSLFFLLFSYSSTCHSFLISSLVFILFFISHLLLLLLLLPLFPLLYPSFFFFFFFFFFQSYFSHSISHSVSSSFNSSDCINHYWWKTLFLVLKTQEYESANHLVTANLETIPKTVWRILLHTWFHLIQSVFKQFSMPKLQLAGYSANLDVTIALHNLFTK